MNREAMDGKRGMAGVLALQTLSHEMQGHLLSFWLTRADDRATYGEPRRFLDELYEISAMAGTHPELVIAFLEWSTITDKILSSGTDGAFTPGMQTYSMGEPVDHMVRA